jgi:monothiol glutaredoxin
MTNILEKIQETVSSNNVVLFMKGTQDFPQCGFSAVVVQILKNTGVEFLDVNVLSDLEIRQGIKEFSDWPTIPQLYIKGEFIGGCDIVKEMFQSGELQEVLKEKGVL